MSLFELDENSPTMKQPRGLKVKLRPHQLTAVKAMKQMETDGSIIINQPSLDSGLYKTVKSNINDINEFVSSTYVLETNSGILADKVGSGKSYMIVSLILSEIVPKIHDRFILGNNHFTVKMLSDKASVPVNLIVVPHNLATQWDKFISDSKLRSKLFNLVSDFDELFDIDYVQSPVYDKNRPNNYTKFTKKKKPTKTAINSVNKNAKKTAGSKTVRNTQTPVIYERAIINDKKVSKLLSETDVIILNVNRYKYFKNIFINVKWARVIVDEMDSAGLQATFSEFGNFNWFLTATPTNMFYKSCRRYVNKIFGTHTFMLNYFIVKNKDSYVNKSVILPSPHVYMVRTMLNRMASIVRDMIPKEVLDLINSGNMKEAVAKLNCDVDTEENIIKVLTNKIETELHNLKVELTFNQSLIPSNKDAHEKKLNDLTNSIKRCETRLESIKERISSINDECCIICADDFDNPTVTACCNNVFCLKCLLNAIKASEGTCPFCRQKVPAKKGYHVISSEPVKKDVKATKIVTGKKFIEMDKTDVLEEILKHIATSEKASKILIFSDHPQTFDKIKANIKNAKLVYSKIAGIPARIANVIEKFNNGEINVLLMDSKQYGSGLNIQSADYLILFHRMKPELEEQVIGRAQRYGRKTNLRIIYLINETEKSTSILARYPHNLESSDELWTVTDPPYPAESGEFCDSEDEDETESESESEPEPLTKAKKSVSKKSTSKKTISKKSISKKSKDTNSDQEMDDIFLDIKETKTKAKKKTSGSKTARTNRTSKSKSKKSSRD